MFKAIFRLIRNTFSPRRRELAHGSGRLLTEDRDIPSFDEIEVSGAISVFVRSGFRETTLSITAEDNILPMIATKVTGTRLIVEAKGSYSSDVGILAC